MFVWISAEGPKISMCFSGFLLKIQKKFHVFVWISAENPKKFHVFVWISAENPKKINFFFGFLLQIQKFPCVFLDFC